VADFLNAAFSFSRLKSALRATSIMTGLSGWMSLPGSTQRCKQEHWQNQLIPSPDCGPRRETDMMGPQDRDQESLFYEFRLAERISESHLLCRLNRFAWLT